jgi:hypothetical protein
MKKAILLFVIFCSFMFGHTQNVVQIQDTVFIKMGETIEFNPIKNDYDSTGAEIKILDARNQNSSDIKVIGFNDTSVVIVAPQYINPDDNWTIFYKTNENSSYPSEWGQIRLFLNRSNVDTLNINNINAPILPSNVQFFDPYNNYTWDSIHFEYPKKSNRNTIWSQSLWIGGRNSNSELCFSGERFGADGFDFWPGPLSEDGNLTIDSTIVNNWNRTWKITKEEINYHITHYSEAGYQMPDDIRDWPAHGNPELNQAEYLAPFIDVDLNAIYEPENGDYPLIKGDMSVFFIYNDSVMHLDSQGKPLGIEVHCLAWAIEDSENKKEYNNTIFLDYKIFNRSEITYDSTYLGLYTYFQLGNAYDNYLGCNVEDGYMYSYNGDEFDEDFYFDGVYYSYGYYDEIPAQGVCVLGGPFIDADQFDNPSDHCNESINGVGFGDGVIDNERFGMTNFYMHFDHSQFPSWMSALERYDYMQGYLLNDFTYGDENGIWRFMFPGETDSCDWGFNGVNPNLDTIWTEETTGNAPGERTGIIGIGPFTFEAGSVEYLDIALVTAPGDQGVDSKELLEEYVEAIRAEYIKNPEEFGNQYLGAEELVFEPNESISIFPNPTKGDQIHINLPKEQEANYFIYNATSQLVKQGFLLTQKQQEMDISDLPSGWFVLEVIQNGKAYRTKLIKH